MVKWATGVLGLDASDTAVLSRLGISGRALLSLGASWANHLATSCMTLGALRSTMPQAVEEIRGARGSRVEQRCLPNDRFLL